MAEKLNGPGFGARMAMAAVQAPSFEVLKGHLADIAAASAAAQDQLRQLLSYCEIEAETFDPSASEAYGDVAARLRAILDGE